MKIAARSSPLSKAQVQEVIEALKACGQEPPKVSPVWLISQGDKDLLSSLKERGKDDFFTKEIDDCVLRGHVDIAIHSAKDLPQTLDEGLEIVALTKGVDSADMLVMKQGYTLESLPARAQIGSSSHRRDEVVSALRADLVTVDIRGSVDARVRQVLEGPLDGAVIAKAALIRLNLMHLNMIELPGPTVPYQGQLAIVAKKDHKKMHDLFSALDVRKKQKRVVYFGLKPTFSLPYTHHIPLIQTKLLPYPDFAISAWRYYEDYTHFVFTSKQGVRYFYEALKHYRLDPAVIAQKQVFAIGQATALELKKRGVEKVLVPLNETQEGLTSLMAIHSLVKPFFLIAGAEKMRRHLTHFLAVQKLRFQKISLYETLFTEADLEGVESEYDEYIFSSPSQVEAYAQQSKRWPKREKVKAIGVVTQRKLNFYLS